MSLNEKRDKKGARISPVLLKAGTAMAANSQRIYELKVHSHFKAVGTDAANGIAGASAVEIPKRKEF